MFNDLILNITKKFYPKGRAFRIPKGGVLEQVHKALAISENQAYEDTLSILDSILPDNPGFTLEDATDWERRLGLITNLSVSFADRKAAILRKMNHPGTIKARQHHLYVQGQLQAANFDVYVHENRFLDLGVWKSKSPSEVYGSAATGGAVHRTSLQHSQVQHGAEWNDKIANHIDPALDRVFDVGQNYRSTFFIGGQVLGTFATIAPGREAEFRQLVLKLKPAHTVAYIFINFANGDYNNDYNNDFNIQ